MPEQIDPLRSVFAELRSSALSSMRAPGAEAVILEREKIQRQTIANRRLQHHLQAA